jgi:signal recognition particle subunit SRP19
MRSRKPFLIFWPQYFEAKRTRAEGRRVPKKYAIERLDKNLLMKAAGQLGYNVQFERDYKYPKSWWDEPGRILINTKGKKKSKVMIELAKEIKKIQQKT